MFVFKILHGILRLSLRSLPLIIIPVTRKLIFNAFSKRFNKKNNTSEKKDFIEGEYKDMDEK